MKILHICTGWPLSYKGGITNYVRVLATTQHKAGEDVYVLGAPDNNEYEFRYIQYTSDKIVPFTYSPLVDKEALNTVQNLLDKEKFDIIHIHALEYIDWDLYSIIKNYHYVVSLHDYCFICPRVYMYTPNNEVCEKYDELKCQRCISYLERFKLVRRIVNKMNRMYGISFKVPYIKQNISTIRYTKSLELLNNADMILPVSYKVEEIYRNSGITTKSKVLHIGNESADNYKDEYELLDGEHKIKIVFLGRLTSYKGADLFIRIAKELYGNNNVEFHFLGDSGEYKEIIEKVGINDHGRYNPSDLSALLKDYDIGMVLSVWHDNGPQVVMELLNNHIPVIGTRMGGIPDFVNEDNGYLFNPYLEDEIMGVVNFLNKLTIEQVNCMKRNIRRTITTQEHYTQLMQVYSEVLNCDSNC